MILFVFEGGKAEPKVFDSLQKLFLGGEEVRVVACQYDLPTLFSRLKKNNYDLFRTLPLEENGIIIPDDIRLDTFFSQIFLFFDYDFQNKIGLENVNYILSEMLDFFDNETDNGKLYINYPMVESLKYTKELPDSDYYTYHVSREDCAHFKGMAESFAFPKAKQYRFIDLTKTTPEEVKENWNLLKQQNVSKANYLVNGDNVVPVQKDDINQKAIFDGQTNKFVKVNETVSILNSFPLFLFEYMK